MTEDRKRIFEFGVGKAKFGMMKHRTEGMGYAFFSPTSHRGVGAGPYGPEAEFSYMPYALCAMPFSPQRATRNPQPATRYPQLFVIPDHDDAIF